MRADLRAYAGRPSFFLSQNHCAAIALHFAVYSFVKVHRSIRMTPAMKARLTPTLWSMGDLVNALVSF